MGQDRQTRTRWTRDRMDKHGADRHGTRQTRDGMDTGRDGHGTGWTDTGQDRLDTGQDRQTWARQTRDRTDMGQDRQTRDRHRTGQTDRHGTDRHRTDRHRTGWTGGGQARESLQGPRWAQICLPPRAPSPWGDLVPAPPPAAHALLCNYRPAGALLKPSRAPTVHSRGSRELKALAGLGRDHPNPRPAPHFLSQRSWSPMATAAGGDEGVKPEKPS